MTQHHQDWSPHPERGFLPAEDPLRTLPAAFAEWESVAQTLPKLIAAQRVRAAIDALPPFNTDQLSATPEFWRAHVILSHLSNCYVWADPPVIDRVPAALALPWHTVSAALGMRPMLTYADWTLHKWFRHDPTQPIALGNIALTQNCAGGLDEEWFVLVHVAIEAAASRGLAVLQPAQLAARQEDSFEVSNHLDTLAATLDTLCKLMHRMYERCDPYVYYHRVRPYMFGWRNNPALPNGMIYTGVAEYAGHPQFFYGETGAQSTIVPSFDAALGIHHEQDEMRVYLRAMLDYVPPQHRGFVERLEVQNSVRAFVQRAASASLHDAYNACVTHLETFRKLHLQLASDYIYKQNKASDVGTGGTSFMTYLSKHRAETRSSLL